MGVGLNPFDQSRGQLIHGSVILDGFSPRKTGGQLTHRLTYTRVYTEYIQ